LSLPSFPARRSSDLPMPRLAPVTSAERPVRSDVCGNGVDCVTSHTVSVHRVGAGQLCPRRPEGLVGKTDRHAPVDWHVVITATDLEVRAGARTLLSAPGDALRIQPGDRIGLVGRNGAAKPTTLRILAGEPEPYAGTVRRSGPIGYLPQDPKEGDLDVLAKDRVLSARGLDEILRDMEKQQALMAETAD